MHTIIDRLAGLVRVIAGALLVLVTGCMVTVIAGRYAGFSTAWADEVARIAFVWSASLGAASGIHKGMHFAVFQVSAVRHPRARQLLETVSIAIVLSVCAALTWSTTQSLPVAALSILPAIGISNATFHLALSVFGILSMLFLLTRLVRVWRQADAITPSPAR